MRAADSLPLMARRAAAKRTSARPGPAKRPDGTTTAEPSIPPAEFASRREALLKQLKNAVGLVFAGDHDPSLHHEWRPHPHFEYLTGITDEPGAALLLDPAHPVAARRVQLFLRPLNPEVEKWDGLRDTIASPMRARYGISTIFRTNALPRWLLESASRAKRLACLHPLAAHTAPVSPDLAVFRESGARIPGCSIVDASDLIPKMRARKSSREVAMVERALSITREGYLAAMRTIRPGISEFDVQEAMEHAYRTNGSRGTAYRTIAGTGINATVLHYHANSATLEAGQLMVIDSGCSFGGYASDITRTFPVSGRFTARQRELYEIVLKAQAAAIAAIRPGVTLADFDRAARQVITKAGYGDWFIHGTGHHLGLEVHDASPDAPLAPGAIVTVEPGIYIPDEKIGIRIEDDVLVTPGGRRVLGPAIPKTVAEIERAMSRR
jgi:Xaa-Pro aminopeptidase